MLAAEKRRREDLADIRETFYVGIADDRDIIIKRLKRGGEHAGMGDRSKQENNAHKRHIVFGDLMSNHLHYWIEEKTAVKIRTFNALKK